MRLMFIVIACFAACGLPAVAGIVNPSPESARFVHFTVEGGLSQNTVRAILQDRDGFLWVATEEGLNRFDGYSFVVFRHRADDPHSIPSDFVTALFEDKAGRIWIGTRDGLSSFDPNTEALSEPMLPHEHVMAIREDRQGRLWVGTAEGGLFRRDRTPARWTQYKTNPADPRSLANDSVYALLEDRSARLWIGTHGGGLGLYDPGSDGFVRHQHDTHNPRSLADNEIWSLAEDSAGRIWVGTGAGISALDPRSGSFRHFRNDPANPNSLQGDLVAALFVDRAGTVWLGTDQGGLSRYVPETESFVAYKQLPASPESLSRSAVTSIFEDVQGNLWIGTFAGGLNWLRRNNHAFEYYTQRPQESAGLSGDGVGAFLEDRAGNLWIGTAEGSLNRFDTRTRTFTTYRMKVAAPILTLQQDQAGSIWLGTWGYGLYRFDPRRGTFTSYHDVLDDPSTRADNNVWAMQEEQPGVLWLATDNGLIRFDSVARKVVPIKADRSRNTSLSSNQVRAFHRDEDGKLWVGTFGGGISVLQPDGKTFVHYRHNSREEKSLSSDWVMALHSDRRGRLWIGTSGGGLALFDRADQTFVTFRESDGLPSRTVYAIMEDDQGKLWVGTNNGLCRFDPESRTGETFDTSNGLQSIQFNLGAARRTRSGTMLFGTTSGFYHFDPSRIVPDPHVPPIALTSVKVLNEPRKTPLALLHSNQLELKYDDKILTFEFAVLDFTFPRRSRYRYKLEGFDEDWVELKSKRDVTFTNLDPGNYVLRVNGSNNDGTWSETPAALELVIPPPYWRTIWFRASALLLVLGVGFSAHRYRIRQHLDRERELEERVEEAMSKLKIMKGLLPICATCKKVRDDRGYWNQIESYIRTHSEADFSHGICPDCIVKYWGNTRAAGSAKKRES